MAETQDQLLARMMSVRASMLADGWPCYPVPADWHPTAQQLRFLWWRDYGVAEWFVAESEPDPLTSKVQEPRWRQPLSSASHTYNQPARPMPVVNGLGGTRREGLASAGVALAIICAALVWAAILDSVAGLDTLRRLRGWTLY